MKTVKAILCVVGATVLASILLADKLFQGTEDITADSLSDRYREDFKFMGFEESQSENGRTMLFKGKYGTTVVTRYFDEEGNAQYQDDYMGYIYNNCIQKIVSDSAKKVFGDCKAEFDVKSSKYPKNTSIDLEVMNLFKSGDMIVKVNIEITSDIDDQHIQGFVSELFDKYNMKVDCKIESREGGNIYFATDEKGCLSYINRE